MAKKKKVKKFAWEKKAKIAKPKKTDFIKEKTKKSKWAYKEKKQTNKNAKKKFIQPRTVFGWEDREHISKPKASDFKEPKKKPLKWSIPWLKSLIFPEKIEEPKREDFEEKEERKVSQPIITAREIITKETIITEKKTIKEKPKFEEEPITTEDSGILPKIMLFVIGLCYLVFLGLIATMFMNVTFEEYMLVENTFFILTIISIILAAIYSYKKEVFRGFIYISLIILIYIILGAIFAEPLLKTLNVLLLVLTILPIQVYLVNYVK